MPRRLEEAIKISAYTAARRVGRSVRQQHQPGAKLSTGNKRYRQSDFAALPPTTLRSAMVSPSPAEGGGIEDQTGGPAHAVSAIMRIGFIRAALGAEVSRQWQFGSGMKSWEQCRYLGAPALSSSARKSTPSFRAPPWRVVQRHKSFARVSCQRRFGRQWPAANPPDIVRSKPIQPRARLC